MHWPAVASEELAAELYEDACDFLAANGFAQYEISNFSRAAEHQSLHNRKYWERAPYLGFGLDAQLMLLRTDGSAIRFANAADLEAYDAGTGDEITGVSERAAFEESVFLGLRLNEGLSVNSLRERFPVTWIRDCEERVGYLAREGLMLVEGDRWKLTRRGRLVSSEVFGELLAVMA
jgi:oxygen-independent coproporphyrinogen-3 oxidase